MGHDVVEIPGVTTEKVPYGDDGKMAQVVHCSTCTETLPIIKTTAAFKPPQMVAKQATRKNWKWDKKGKHLCPNCAKPERAEPEPDLPPQMDSTHRRSIFRALDEHYDTERVRYKGEMNDLDLARGLNLPVSWVAEVREELFGPSGANEAMESLREELAALAKEAETVSARALKDAEAMEVIKTRCTELQAKLEAL